MNTTLWIDGGMYVLGAIFIFTQGFFSTDEVYKYVDPVTVFWIRYCTGSGAAACAALKAFRSMTFARITRQKAEADNSTPTQQTQTS